jgi:hypothetical protein
VDRPELDELGYGHDIVPPVGAPGHAAHEAFGGERVLVVPAGVLAAPIGMMQEPGERTRRTSAMSRASSVSPRVMRSLIAQPTTKREQRSNLTLLYQAPGGALILTPCQEP